MSLNGKADGGGSNIVLFFDKSTLNIVFHGWVRIAEGVKREKKKMFNMTFSATGL